MMAIEYTSQNHGMNKRQSLEFVHDTSQNSVAMPDLQVLRNPLFGDNCDREDRLETEAEYETDSAPAAWIVRACEELWARIGRDNQDPSSTEHYNKINELSGTQMITRLMQVSGKTDRLLATGVWQVLLEEKVIEVSADKKSNLNFKTEFVDRNDMYYRCICALIRRENEVSLSENIVDNFSSGESREISSSAPEEKLENSLSPNANRSIITRLDSLDLDEPPQKADRFQLLIDRLYGLAGDAMFRRILLKSPAKRDKDELDFVFHELHLVPSLCRLSRNVRHELSRCLLYEIYAKAGTIVFNQGDPGTSWYIIHRGSVWVYVKGQGHVCRLSEGDDFGKLALVTGAPRAASIVVAENNCHLLKVEKTDFDRILRDVEANIVRLKERDSDVLILERLMESEASKSTYHSSLNKEDRIEKRVSTRFIDHSIVAGTTEKIVQHILDVRLGGMEHKLEMLMNSQITGLCLCPQILLNVDQVLEDFIMTYTLFTNDANLFELLFSYMHAVNTPAINKDMDTLHVGRILVFLYCWCQCLGLALFIRIDNIKGFLDKLQKHIDECLPESLQSKVIARLLTACDVLLRDKEDLTNGQKSSNGNEHGSTQMTDTLSGPGISRSVSVRRTTGSRKIFGLSRFSDTTDSREQSTGVVDQAKSHPSSCPLNRQPHVYSTYCTFSPNKLPFTDDHHIMHCIVYSEGGRNQYPLTVPLNCTVKDIKQEVIKHFLDCSDVTQFCLVEVSSRGDRVAFDDHERGVILGLAPNSCLFAVPNDKVQTLAPLPIQLSVAMNFLEQHEFEKHQSNQDLQYKEFKSHSPLLRRTASTAVTFRALDEFTVDEVAAILTLFVARVAVCIGSRELIDYTMGTKKATSAAAHVRVLISHFSMIHTWTITQVVTTTLLSRRAQLVKKFIKLADRLIDAPYHNQHICFAIVLGLHSTPVTRLTQTWERVPIRWRRVYLNRLVPLVDPARNHRAARTWIASTQLPHIPFLALVLKDLRFAEDANQTYYAEQTGSVKLINFDKMRLVAQSLRLWTRAITEYDWLHPQSDNGNHYLSFDNSYDGGLQQKVFELSLEHFHTFFSNLQCIDDIRVLTQLSVRLEPRKS